MTLQPHQLPTSLPLSLPYRLPPLPFRLLTSSFRLLPSLASHHVCWLLCGSPLRHSPPLKQLEKAAFVCSSRKTGHSSAGRQQCLHIQLWHLHRCLTISSYAVYSGISGIVTVTDTASTAVNLKINITFPPLWRTLFQEGWDLCQQHKKTLPSKNVLSLRFCHSW
jgi:hypothetical protein